MNVKNLLRFIFTLLLVCFALAGCLNQDTQQQINESNQSEQSRIDEIINTFKDKYSALDFNIESDNVSFSAEIVDKYRGMNVYASILHIDDVFYLDDDLYLYAESWDEQFMLKITPEQYSAIKELNNSYFDFGLHIIFNIDNVEPMIPVLDANFYFDISSPDDVSADNDTSVSFNSRIIKGTLIDIIEVSE